MKSEQTLLATAIYCGQIQLSVDLALMGCEHASLTSADFTTDDAQGVYSWSHAADEDLNCLQAAKAAYAVCRHHRMRILQMTGWWHHGEHGLVVVAWKGLTNASMPIPIKCLPWRS